MLKVSPSSREISPVEFKLPQLPEIFDDLNGVSLNGILLQSTKHIGDGPVICSLD